MAGYKQRSVRLDFPDISEDGDEVFVVIANPKTVPASAFESGLDDNENPKTEEIRLASRQIIAGFIRDWHVYDATAEDEDQPLLPLPATPDAVAKLPQEIIKAINTALRGGTDPQ